MLTKEQQVNKLTKKFSQICEQATISSAELAFHGIPKEMYLKDELMNFLKQKGLPSISLADEKYYVTTIEKIRDIIEFDLSNFKKWLEDVLDCDNKALYMSARVAFLFKINSFGTCFGDIYNTLTKKRIGGHAYNLPLATDDGKLKLYLYEPQNDIITEWRTDGINTIKKWDYLNKWAFYFILTLFILPWAFYF